MGGVEFYGIGCFHQLMGIVTGPHGVGYHALLQRVGEPASLLRELEKLDRSLAQQSLPPEARLPLTPSGHRIVKQAIVEATRLGHDWVGTEHLLLAICSAADMSTRERLSRRGITHEFVSAFVVKNQQQIDPAPFPEN